MNIRSFLVSTSVSVVLCATAALSQAVSSGSVNGIEYNVIGGGNQSISAKDGGIEITSDNVVILVLADSVSVDGVRQAVDAFQEVTVDRSNGGLEISLDGRQIFGLSNFDALNGRVAEGDIDAMNDLSILLFEGDGVAADPVRAEALLRQSAEAGNVYAQSNLAGRLANGIGVEENHEEAFRWAVLAADKENAIAQVLAGRLLIYGVGTGVDADRALAYLGAALAQDNGSAATELGYIYGAGIEVPRDYSRAVGFYQRGVELGQARSAFNLAVVALETNGAAVSVEDGLAAIDTALSLGWAEDTDAVRASLTDLLGPPLERYFYADGDTPIGPMTIEALRSLMADGTINLETLAWEGGTEDWVPLVQIQNLNQ